MLKILATAISIAGTFAALANEPAVNGYPGSKTVKMIVPYAAGGPGDILTRAVADVLGRKLKGTFIIENIPGGTQVIGARRAAAAPPDGTTLFLGSIASLAINPNSMKSLPYSPTADFEPITLLNMTPQILVVRPDFPANTFQEMIELAKKNPGKLTYASLGPGSSQFFAGELLNKLAGIEITQVPYTGAAPALRDVMGGFVDMTYTTGVLNYLANNQLKALAITSAKRSPAAPEIPSLAELGWPQFDQSVWWGLLAPKDTPKDIRELISEVIREAAKTGDLQKHLGAIGEETQIVVSTPEEFRKFIAEEIIKWRDVIRVLGANRE